MSYGWPCDHGITITQYFAQDPRPDYQPDGHTGLDFGCPIGSPLYAIADGIVEVADWADNALGPDNAFGVAVTAWIGRSAGRTIIINHPAVFALYGHVSDIYVSPGQRVTRGQLIGRSGDTGFTFGAHLHFEILPDGFNWRTQRWYGRANPLDYITKTGGQASPAAVSSTQRITGPEGAKYRPEPNTNLKETNLFAPGDVLNFVGFVRGQDVAGNTVWFKGIGGGYVWSGATTNPDPAGLPDLSPAAPAPVSPKQRITGPEGAKYRPEPNTNLKETKLFAPGDVLNFVGFVRGQDVAGNTVWFKGIGGGFVWSGATTNPEPAGLPDLSPAAPVSAPAPETPAASPSPSERRVGDKGANQRLLPSTKAEITAELPPGFVFTAAGYVKGDFPDDVNRIWFVGKNSGHYVWSGACVDPSIGDLPDLTASIPVKPVSPVPPKLVKVEVPTFPADFACVTSVVPAHPDNYEVGNFPALPKGYVAHQYGAPGIKLSSVKIYFAMGLEQRRKADPKAGVSSAHFGIDDDETVQFVPFNCRAYGAGAGGNDLIQIEIIPNPGPKAIARVRELVGQIQERLGEQIEPHLHKNIAGAATACGTNIPIEQLRGVPLVSKTPETDNSVKEEIKAALAVLTASIERL